MANVDVVGCSFTGIGGRGFTTTLEHTSSAQDATSVTVADSVFRGCGEVFVQQPYCVFVSGASDIRVVHNDISGVMYSGIRVWGFDHPAADFDSGTPVFNVSFNHVHDVGMGFLSDFGAIFVTSRPGPGADCVVAYGADRCAVCVFVFVCVCSYVRVCLVCALCVLSVCFLLCS